MDAKAHSTRPLVSDPDCGTDATQTSRSEAKKASLRVPSPQRLVSNLSSDMPISEAEIRLVMASLGANIAEILRDDQ